MRILILLLSLMLLGCTGSLRPWRGERTAISLRTHMLENFQDLHKVEFEGYLYLQSRRLGQGKLHISGSWAETSGLSLTLKTPLGGRLGQLEVPMNGQSRLELRDERLRPMLFLVEQGLPGQLLSGELKTATQLGPWFWGALVPGKDATFQQEQQRFVHGDSLWTVDSLTGLCNSLVVPGLKLTLEKFRHSGKRRLLPQRIRIIEPELGQSVVISWRHLKSH